MAVVRLIVLLLAGASLAAGASANPGPTFTDAAGDAGGAPDLRSVQISSDAASVTFAIHTTDAATWQNAAAVLEIDADANPATGNAEDHQGYELAYVLHSNHDALTLDESNGVHVARPAASWALNGSALTITIPFSELHVGASKIGFRVETLAASGSDSAPDPSVPPGSSRQAQSQLGSPRPSAQGCPDTARPSLSARSSARSPTEPTE